MRRHAEHATVLQVHFLFLLELDDRELKHSCFSEAKELEEGGQKGEWGPEGGLALFCTVGDEQRREAANDDDEDEVQAACQTKGRVRGVKGE